MKRASRFSLRFLDDAWPARPYGLWSKNDSDGNDYNTMHLRPMGLAQQRSQGPPHEYSSVGGLAKPTEERELVVRTAPPWHDVIAPARNASGFVGRTWRGWRGTVCFVLSLCTALVQAFGVSFSVIQSAANSVAQNVDLNAPAFLPARTAHLAGPARQAGGTALMCVKKRVKQIRWVIHRTGILGNGEDAIFNPRS